MTGGKFSALKFLWNSPLVLLVRVEQVRKLDNASKQVGSVPLYDYSVHAISWALILNFVFYIWGVRSAAARLPRSWVRIPPGAWIFVCCECCVLSGRGLCYELITRPEESYRLWCVVVCDLKTSRMTLGRSATAKKNYCTLKTHNSWNVAN